MTPNAESAVAAGNLFKLSRLGVVLERANRKGIAVLVLKGAAFLGWLYDLHERGMVDVDILIRSRDRDAFVSALAPEVVVSNRVNPGTVPNYRSGQFSASFQGLALDIHTHLLNRPWLRELVPFDEEGLFQRATRVTIAGRPALRLSTEDQLLHLVAHAVYHHRDWNSEHSDRADDARRLLEREPLNWSRVCELAANQRMKTAAWLFLKDQGLSALVPDTVIESLRPTTWASRRIRLAGGLLKAGDRSFAPVLVTDDPVGVFRAGRAILLPDAGWLAQKYARIPTTPLRTIWHGLRVFGSVVGKLVALVRGRLSVPRGRLGN